MSRRAVCHITFRRMGAVCARKGADDIIRATLPTEAEWHAWYPGEDYGPSLGVLRYQARMSRSTYRQCPRQDGRLRL